MEGEYTRSWTQQIANPNRRYWRGNQKVPPSHTKTRTQHPTVSGTPKEEPQGQQRTVIGASATPAVVAPASGSVVLAYTSGSATQNPTNTALEAGWTLVSRDPGKVGASGHGEQTTPAPPQGRGRPARKNKKGPLTERERLNKNTTNPKEEEARPSVGGGHGSESASVWPAAPGAHPAGRAPFLLGATQQRRCRGPQPMPSVHVSTRQ